MSDCRLGYTEHDGFRYCHEHGGWNHYVERTMHCDRSAPPDRTPTDHQTTEPAAEVRADEGADGHE